MWAAIAVVAAAGLQGVVIYVVGLFVASRRAAKRAPVVEREASLAAADLAVGTITTVLQTVTHEYEERIKRLEDRVRALEADNKRLQRLLRASGL